MPFEVMDWRQMLPDLLQLIQLDNWGGIITIAVLYMVVTFGIFSNILMMLQERLHEFGVLMAIGMKKALLIRVVTLEVLMISAFGTLMGAVLGAPIIAYFHYNPISVSGSVIKAYKQFGIEPVMPFSMQGTIFLWQTLVVFGITLILTLYPYFRLRHLKTIEALRT
jgi:ABC-type antimicrobial peptide transport system permease subunit